MINNKIIRLVCIMFIALLVGCGAVPVKSEGESSGDLVVGENGLWTGLVLAKSDGYLVVKDIYWDSPAEHSGLKVQDRIVEMAGKKIGSLSEAASFLQSLLLGTQPIQIKVIRKEEKAILSYNDKKAEVSLNELEGKYEEFLKEVKTGETLTVQVVKKLVPLEFSVEPVNSPEPVRRERPVKAVSVQSQSGWLGVRLSDIADLAPMGGGKGQKGVKLDEVIADTPAEKAGLKVGDVISRYDDKPFDKGESSAVGILANHIKNCRPGTKLKLHILRPENVISSTRDGKSITIKPDKVIAEVKALPNPSETEVNLTRTYRPLEITATLGARPETKASQPVLEWANATRHPDLIGYQHPIESIVNQIMEWTAITSSYQDLLKRFADDEKWDDGFRLKEITYLHRDPWKMEKITTDWINQLRDNEITLPWLLESLSARLDAYHEPRGLDVEVVVIGRGISAEVHLSQIESILTEVVRLRNEAFAGLTHSDMQFLSDHISGFTDRYVRDFHFSDPDEIAKRNDIDRRVLELVRYVNYEKLFQAAQMLAILVDAEYLKGLAEDIGDKSVVRETKWGKIIIGGKGHDRYTTEAAVIIDLGGDDFYADVGGSSLTRPVSLIIDFNGNDTYSSYHYNCQGSGILGVSILADLAGNDNYIAQNWAQGTGFLGVGVLIDYAGNDTYHGQEYVQGAGFFGIGVLVDNEGDDRYEANLFAQGFASTKGCGLLRDNKGNDKYYALGKYPSGYSGDVGTFNGFSQGCGTGIRCYADGAMSHSGGIGVLLDNAGEDYYEAGTFSQGGGYFFGWGILVDAGDQNDKYIGTRYAQGFSAHSALGFFMDEGGDDYYAARIGVHAGLSWDLTVTMFIDKAGNDIYDYEEGFSIGAAAHNGFCLFYDAGGNDTYNCNLTRASTNSYHGGTSLSVFLDEACAKDIQVGKLGLDTIEVTKEYAITMNLNKRLDELSEEEIKSILKDRTKETTDRPAE